MISFFLSLLLGLIALVCLGLKMTGRKFSKSWDIAICLVVPILCILMFVSMMVETSIRRSANMKELDAIISVVEYSLNSDRVFRTNEEKARCLDSLNVYMERVNDIAFNDSLISVVSGKDTCMQKRIAKSNNAVAQSIKWIRRLNDFCQDKIYYDCKEKDKGTIKLIGPGSGETSVLNMAFRLVEKPENIVCAFAQVICAEDTLYSQAFRLNNPTNCFNIPYSHKDGEEIELGYITQDNGTMIFKYITYGK